MRSPRCLRACVSRLAPLIRWCKLLLALAGIVDIVPDTVGPMIIFLFFSKTFAGFEMKSPLRRGGRCGYYWSLSLYGG
jgi:hypothetical protein